MENLDHLIFIEPWQTLYANFSTYVTTVYNRVSAWILGNKLQSLLIGQNTNEIEVFDIADYLNLYQYEKCIHLLQLPW